ncbi:hypothetical protein [Methanoregula sp.]|uniref:hypothetical protein n=1 Tax=Methanoregula sp. TaxID=2052170 RepID=UPI00236F2B9A|nr:hypothetical protein [Methanoregula sp.]MDD1686280.1 hypothetical protein [Methanoregula sp.]
MIKLSIVIDDYARIFARGIDPSRVFGSVPGMIARLDEDPRMTTQGIILTTVQPKIPSRHFPGQPFPQDSNSLMIQKAIIRRFLEAEMPLKQGL